METSNEQHMPLLDHEGSEELESELDLDSTTFFADEDILEGQELSYSQKVERVNLLLLRNTLYRPTLYRILATVKSSPVSFYELEAVIQTMPEFQSVTQPPSALIEWLSEVEALIITEVDEEGNPIPDEDREGKTEDEIDDMVFDLLVEITDYGKETLETFNPLNRLTSLLEDKPQRYNTYRELLEFLKQKRSYREIDLLLQGNPILMDGVKADGRPMLPSVFVDKLAAAGAIVYENGWVITPEGLHFLENAPPVLNA